VVMAQQQVRAGVDEACGPGAAAAP
jgi:hypothetical protein